MNFSNKTNIWLKKKVVEKHIRFKKNCKSFKWISILDNKLDLVGTNSFAVCSSFRNKTKV